MTWWISLMAIAIARRISDELFTDGIKVKEEETMLDLHCRQFAIISLLTFLM